MLLINRMM